MYYRYIYFFLYILIYTFNILDLLALNVFIFPFPLPYDLFSPTVHPAATVRRACATNVPLIWFNDELLKISPSLPLHTSTPSEDTPLAYLLVMLVAHAIAFTFMEVHLTSLPSWHCMRPIQHVACIIYV